MIVVSLLTVSGLIWLFALWRQLHVPVWIAVSLGLALRLIAFNFEPFEELDFFRYFWDGKLLAHGFNPYAYPISDFLTKLPPEILALQKQEAALISSIRQDTLLFSTIYAPLAIVSFALIDLLPGPISSGFFTSFILAELATLVILKRWARPHEFQYCAWAIALNPLLVLVTYNGLHFDVWLFPALLGWLLSLREGRIIPAIIFLLLAIAIRHWPILLVPITLSALPTFRLQIIVGLALASLISLIFLPQAIYFMTDHSGLRAYSRYWELNDAIFTVLSRLFGQSPARILSLCVPILLSLMLPFSKLKNNPALVALILTGSLLMLSPTFFPWYWVWIVPFLLTTYHPIRWSGLVLVATLPLYYLRPLFQESDLEMFFDKVLVWLEFGPSIALALALYLKNVARKLNNPSA